MGNYGIFLIMGQAGFISSAVSVSVKYNGPFTHIRPRLRVSGSVMGRFRQALAGFL